MEKQPQQQITILPENKEVVDAKNEDSLIDLFMNDFMEDEDAISEFIENRHDELDWAHNWYIYGCYNRTNPTESRPLLVSFTQYIVASDILSFAVKMGQSFIRALESRENAESAIRYGFYKKKMSRLKETSQLLLQKIITEAEAFKSDLEMRGVVVPKAMVNDASSGAQKNRVNPWNLIQRNGYLLCNRMGRIKCIKKQAKRTRNKGKDCPVMIEDMVI